MSDCLFRFVQIRQYAESRLMAKRFASTAGDEEGGAVPMEGKVLTRQALLQFFLLSLAFKEYNIPICPCSS